MAKYFVNPFATSGDRIPIPEPVQPSGDVSYTTGFTINYELDQDTNPAAKDVPRDQTNDLYYQITLAIQQYQQNGFPDFITTLDNLGTPFPYDFNAVVKYDDGFIGIRLYQSLITNNTSLPTNTQQWQLLPLYITGTASGSGNVITLNVTQNYETFVSGDKIELTATANNTSATTLQVGSGAVIAVNKMTNTGLQQLDGGEIYIDGIYDIIFNGTVWVLQNPTVDGGVPTGTIIDFAGTIVPIGFLNCDGSAQSRTTYNELFAEIGTTWGAGDGLTTFNIPGLNRRTTIGSGGVATGVIGNTVGSVGGEEAHTMTIPELAAHTHLIPSFNISYQAGGNSVNTVNGGNVQNTSSTGTSTPFNVMQPSAVVLKCIKY